MAHQYTEEELQLTIGDLILSRPRLNINELMRELFSNDTSNISSVIQSFISTEFFRQNRNLCCLAAKTWIADKLQNGSSDFIRLFMAVKNEDEIIEIFPSDLQYRLHVLKQGNAIGNLFIELNHFFHRLRQKFVPIESEHHFRNFLAEWFQGGFMPWSIWRAFQEWKHLGPTLANLKNVKWPTGVHEDGNWRKAQRLLKNIQTDNFIEVEQLSTVLDVLLAVPKLFIKDDTVKLVGRIVYLSEWAKPIQELIQSNSAAQVAIFAEDVFAIDCDLTNELWQGKNLTIVSNVVHIWVDSIIRLSGHSYTVNSTKAPSAVSTANRGEDGKHGRAGESSGNIAILATKMLNPSKLTVELNGGRGEDGQDGGDGYDGVDGVGITKSDLDILTVTYYSLYRDLWATFQDYSPPANWKKESDFSSDGKYIYRTYKDEHSRAMTYSFAADKGWTYTTYELYVLICGSNGTSGSSGGSNGIGGQGGYNGTSTAQNLESGEEFKINIIRDGKNSGPNGNNGKIGRSGKHGIDGNDMVLIDRSATDASKYYEGCVDRKLTHDYVYKAEQKSRLDGYKHYVAKQNACFIKFNDETKIDTTERRATQAQEITVRSSASVAVAKKSIVIEQVLSDAQIIFGKQSALLADAHRTTAQVVIHENEGTEEETSITGTEEVVILRQKEETSKLVKYTPDSEKKQNITHTPETFINSIKLAGRQTTLNNLAQILFDLFIIEFPPALLDTIALKTLFYQMKYRERVQSSFAFVLVAALQSKLVNGKSYEEINQFTSHLSIRRKKKFSLTRFRQILQNVSQEVDEAVVFPVTNLVPGTETYFGVKEDTLSAVLAPYIYPTNIEPVIVEFFSQYLVNKVDIELLAAFNTFLTMIKPRDRQLLASFAQDKSFKWTDKDLVRTYLASLKAWYAEDVSLSEVNKKTKNATGTQCMKAGEDHEQSNSHLKQQKTESESDFKTFLEAIAVDLTYWKNITHSITQLIASSPEHTARFGSAPSASIDETTIEHAQYIIYLYHLANSILTYNHILYICNAMMLKERGQYSHEICVDTNNGFDSFLEQYTERAMITNSDECETYMKRGLACAPFRYLLSLHLNIKLCSYRRTRYQTLQNIEILNPTAEQCETIWLQDDRQPAGIAVDEGFRMLIAAQKSIVSKYEQDLVTEMQTHIKIDYSREEDMMEFASYFSASLQSVVIEWMENYIAMTQDQSLLQLLHNRLWIDGCHFSLFEFQFILTSAAILQTKYQCDINYLLLLTNSVSQSELVDMFLYVRLEYHFGRRFTNSSRIFNGIQVIPNSRYKVLLAVKLLDYKSSINEDDLYKIILMLQHASNGSEQLVKMNLDEWISIAQKQKWSEIECLLQKYGSIGYYLGLLDNKEFKGEEQKLRQIIDKATIIPEKTIALYTQLIITREIDGNNDLFNYLGEIFTKAASHPELKDKVITHKLITTEIEQAKLIDWLTTVETSKYHVDISSFTSKDDRTLDEVMEKTIGLHDSQEAAEKRRQNIRDIGKLLKANDSNQSKTIYWLKNFDDALFRLKGKRLRNTQKMAVLCAIESDKHVLEQVNTGEGKSFVIAAMATIRCKTGYRYVDIITSSPVLAQRDAAEMTELYNALGLTVADNCDEDYEARKKAYTADIVYGDIARFQRDHLLHTFYKRPLKGNRTQTAVIVDEVDNMLLDNGNNVLYLSHTVSGMNLLDSLLIFIQREIHSPIYTGDKSNLEQMQEQFDSSTIKRKVLADIFGHFPIQDLRVIADASIDDAMITTLYDQLIQGQFIDSDGYLKIHHHDQLERLDEALLHTDKALIYRMKACFSVVLSRERSIEIPVYLRNFAKLHLDEFIENCKQSLFLEVNTGYVVDVDHARKMTSTLEPLITIIDPNTGADLATSQWCGGLHQFLQLKHGCRLSSISLKAVFVSNVAYLKGYERINGLSGTLGSTEESKTLIELYDADLIKIPTNKPKLFYEHVPVIATERHRWIENIYDEICDQVSGKRSVLVICEDIKQLEYVYHGLTRCFQMDANISQQDEQCFTNIITYKREHDEFSFEDEHKLQSHRLILATNLAGRGTDIKLSQSLIDAGGLHVITAFMPRNCRIEEQAFGRVARCGQPGSAQIIAYAHPVDDGLQPSVFQLKTFRDNAEIHRLQTLKLFYDYHTAVEEACLEKFRNYCDQALSTMYSRNLSVNSESLPTPFQVIYFALLDQWALWLDGQASLIEQCKHEHSQHLKDMIINSVDDFLNKHPFGNQSDCFEVAKTWISAPQSCLTLGLIQMSHKNGFLDADDTFNKILSDGCDFGAEAFYYKASMRMKNFERTRQDLQCLTLSKEGSFDENIEEAIEYFYKARTLFFHRLQRKQREASIVMQMIEKLPENNPKTSGFASQFKSISIYIELILTNIDYLLGSPCHPTMFAENEISEEYSREIHDALYRQGLISPTLLTGRSIEDWQIEPIRRRYKLHRTQIETLIHRIAADPTTLAFNKYYALDRSTLRDKCCLSTKSEFWVELEQQKALYNSTIYLVVHDQSLLSEELLENLGKLESYSIKNSNEVRTLLRYSDEIHMGTLYKLNDIEHILEDSPQLKNEIYELIKKEILKLDKLADILIVPESMSYFSNFDGVTTDDLKEFFRLDHHSAGWILNTLQENGILKLQTVRMMRLTSNDEIWKQKVSIHLGEDTKIPQDNDPIEFKLLFKNAEILQEIKDNRRILNVTEDVIGLVCKMSHGNGKEMIQQFYNYLIEEEILESYLFNIWRLNSKLDCSSLPSCIAQYIDEFLSDRFAYTFALEELCLSLERANADPTPNPSRIFLPENPFSELFDDLINCGLAMPSRIFVPSDHINLFNYEDFQGHETIKSIVYSNRLKLYDQTGFQMDMIPFSAYVFDRGFSVDSDLQNMINNGLKLVVAHKKQTAGSLLSYKVISGAITSWNQIQSTASQITSFGYSVVKFAFSLPNRIFETATDVAAPYAKQVGELIQRIAQPLLHTKFGKAGIETVQAATDYAIEATYNTVEGAERIANIVNNSVNYARQKSIDISSWLIESKKEKITSRSNKHTTSRATSRTIWKSAAEIATYVYTKMSRFCTALSESYHYYNQCRTISRRIVLERYHWIDEHSILKMFHEISRSEAKKTNEKIYMNEVIRKNIESWRTPLMNSILSILNKKLQSLSNDQYTVDFVKSCQEKSIALSNLESAITHLLSFHAWTTQVSYFKTIQTAFRNNTPLNQMIWVSPDGIPKELQFFIEDGIDEILEDLQKRIDDDTYETDEKYETAIMINNIMYNSGHSRNWKESFKTAIVNIAQRTVDSTFIEKTIAVILSYTASLRDVNMPASEAQLNFNREDQTLKQALAEYNVTNESKKKSQFLTNELHTIIYECVRDGGALRNKTLIKIAVKYGYPLPLSSIVLITSAMNSFLEKSNIYHGDISVEITSDQNCVVEKCQSKDGAVKLKVRHFNGSLFLCQSDYLVCVGMSDQMHHEVNETFFYESFIGHMKNLQSCFPRQAETLREGIVKELEYL